MDYETIKEELGEMPKEGLYSPKFRQIGFSTATFDALKRQVGTWDIPGDWFITDWAPKVVDELGDILTPVPMSWVESLLAPDEEE